MLPKQASAPSLITPTTASDVLETVEGTIDSVKKIISGKGHDRQHSPIRKVLPGSESRESTTSLVPRDTDERPARSRESSKLSKTAVPKGEPIVLHGWTPTKPTGFRDVCRAIRETAFVTNPLPIIVSLEVHADEEQQEVMVDIMREEWGSMLLEHPHESCDPHREQPLLQDLLNKILIKVKKTPGKIVVPAAGGGGGGSSSSIIGSTNTTLAAPAGPEEDAWGSDDERAPRQKKSKAVAICEALSALAVYTHSAHFDAAQGFEAAEARTPGHIFSISEGRILELHAARQHELFAHNRAFFMRAFPGGWRVDSSNPEPSTYWRKGVQMVALNWQTFDEGMMVNHAMFADSRGWLLKPPGYLSCPGGEEDGAAVVPTTMVQHCTVRLRVTILAGQHVPLPEARNHGGVGVGAGGNHGFRPYVTVKLYVEKREEAARRGIGNGSGKGSGSVDAPHENFYKRKTPPRRTDHPDFGKDGYSLEFPEIPGVVEPLSFVR